MAIEVGECIHCGCREAAHFPEGSSKRSCMIHKDCDHYSPLEAGFPPLTIEEIIERMRKAGLLHLSR